MCSVNKLYNEIYLSGGTQHYLIIIKIIDETNAVKFKIEKLHINDKCIEHGFVNWNISHWRKQNQIQSKQT